MSSRAGSIRLTLFLPAALGLGKALVDLRGWAMVAMGVRLFLIAIAVLAVAALAFLIATA
jgi:hypothetical protein